MRPTGGKRGFYRKGQRVQSPPSFKLKRKSVFRLEKSSKKANVGLEARASGTGKNKAEVCLNYDGFYEVKVKYGHCASITEFFGFKFRMCSLQ